MNLLKQPRWSPYLVGTGIGILSWATFYFMNKALGTSTSFVGAAAGAECLVAPAHASSNTYFNAEFGAKGGGFKPFIDWQFALDIALIFGAMLAAWLGGTLKAETVPALWKQRFGPSVAKRAVAAFAGGFILLFGARMAGGCTSGHAISGGLQLAVSSWTFLGSMFVAGVLTAGLMFGFSDRPEVKHG